MRLANWIFLPPKTNDMIDYRLTIPTLFLHRPLADELEQTATEGGLDYAGRNEPRPSIQQPARKRFTS